MKHKQAFTLIELLVVVLIIGILAAVALPQYQKAVEKARGVQALSIINSIAQAAQVYYMANGTYPTKFDELAVDMENWTENEKWGDSGEQYTLDTRSNGEWSLQFYKNQTSETLALQIGRLTGKYKGAGFGKEIIRNGEMSNYPVYCAERKTNGIVFNLPAGAYCREIWKATTPPMEAVLMRVYTMP